MRCSAFSFMGASDRHWRPHGWAERKSASRFRHYKAQVAAPIAPRHLPGLIDRPGLSTRWRFEFIHEEARAVDASRIATDPTAFWAARRPMKTTLQNFDSKTWINRFGEALDATAAKVRSCGIPFRIQGQIDRDHHRREQHRRCREMAKLARTDSYAAKLFDESRLWFDTLADGVLDVLLEHPVMDQAWSGGSREGFLIRASAWKRPRRCQVPDRQPRQAVGQGPY